MATRNNAQYYRLGIFVLIGAAALVALVLVFGARNLFDKTMIVETYIKESVQGLDVGAPVRFRGVRIGQVKMINLTGQIYEENIPFSQRKQYVVVRMQITRTTNMNEADEFMNKLVADGLRAQIRGQGITGVNYIELDFVKDPNKMGTLNYEWKPDYPVIPSQPSPVNILLDNVEDALKHFNQLDLNKTQFEVNSLLENLNGLVAGSGDQGNGLNNSVKELNTLLTKLNHATDNQELAIMIEQLTASIVVLRQTLTSMQGDLTISADNVRQITNNVNDLSQKANEYPSWLLFGQPPKRVAP
jgi:phospholipid/cholesterol/gamma-HCH transport system substrate-binding protein/paraquat-inducible protein B